MKRGFVMALYNSKDVLLWVGGYEMDARITRALELALATPPLDSTTINEASNRVAPNIRQDTFTHEGFFDDTPTTGGHAGMNAFRSSNPEVGVVLGGNTQSQRCYACSSKQMAFKTLARVRDLIAENTEMEVQESWTPGILLQVKVTKAASFNGASVDDGASAKNGAGGIGYAFVFSTDGTVTIKIQDSPDNNAWSDLIAFTQFSAVGSERLAVTTYADSGDTVQDNPLTATATTLNVSDGTNFDVGDRIKIDSEIMDVTAIAVNALTIVRGVENTLAAAHVQTTTVNKLEVDRYIRAISTFGTATSVIYGVIWSRN